jgi:hypothetical protein
VGEFYDLKALAHNPDTRCQHILWPGALTNATTTATRVTANVRVLNSTNKLYRCIVDNQEAVAPPAVILSVSAPSVSNSFSSATEIVDNPLESTTALPLSAPPHTSAASWEVHSTKWRVQDAVADDADHTGLIFWAFAKCCQHIGDSALT